MFSTATGYAAVHVDEILPARRGERDSLPAHERLGPHNRQELAPIDELRESDECDSRGVVGAVRSDLAFDITGELLAQEQILGG